jgi:rod shape-determining protein MreD
LRYAALLLFALVLQVAESNLFRFTDALLGWFASATWLPNVVAGGVPACSFPLILFMGVREYPLLRGTATAFGLGYFADLFGEAPVGLYTCVYTGIFLITRASGLRLAAQTRWMQMVLTGGFALIKSALVLGLIAILGKDTWLPKMVYFAAVPHCITTGFFAAGVFALAERIHDLASRVRLNTSREA